MRPVSRARVWRGHVAPGAALADRCPVVDAGRPYESGSWSIEQRRSRCTVAPMSAATTPDAARPWLDDQPVQGPPLPPEWLAYYAQQQEPDRVTRFVQRVW